MRRGKSRWKDLGQPPILRFLPFSTLLSFFSSIHPAYLLSTFSSFSFLFLPFLDPHSYRTTLRFLPFVFHRFLRSPRLAPFLSSTSFTLHFSFSLLSTRQIFSFFSFLPLLIKFHSPVCSSASLFCYLLLCFSPISFRFSFHRFCLVQTVLRILPPPLSLVSNLFYFTRLPFAYFLSSSRRIFPFLSNRFYLEWLMVDRSSSVNEPRRFSNRFHRGYCCSR